MLKGQMLKMEMRYGCIKCSPYLYQVFKNRGDHLGMQHVLSLPGPVVNFSLIHIGIPFTRSIQQFRRIGKKEGRVPIKILLRINKRSRPGMLELNAALRLVKLQADTVSATDVVAHP